MSSSVAVSDSANKGKFSKIVITPAEAQALLENSSFTNRKIRRPMVKRYAADMRAGRWKEDSDLIHIDPDLNLINGFHRMLAVVESGVPVTFNVIYDVDRATIPYIDVGVKRTGKDVIEMALPEFEGSMSGVQTLVNFLYTVETRPDSPWNSSTRLTNHDLVAACEDFDSRKRGMLEMALSQGKIIRKHMGTLDSASSAFWYMLKMSDAPRKQVSEFISFLQRTPDFSDPKYPACVRAVRRAVQDGSTRKNQRVHVGLLIRSWNTFITSGPVTDVWFGDDEILPEILTG